MPQAASSKNERVNLRLNSAAKSRLERAASFEGKTVSGFILSSALEHAEKAIRKHETMVLSRRDAETFLDVIINPPKPNAKLRTALGEHSRRVESR